MTMICELKKKESNNTGALQKPIIKGICEQLRDKKMGTKKLISVVLLMSFSFTGRAQSQSVTAPTFWDDPFNHPLLPLYAISFMIFVTVVLVIITAAYTLKILTLFIERAATERAEKLGVAYVKEMSWWERTWQKWNGSVPLNEEKNIDLGHDFDGIRELDNHLPPWWKLLFIACVVWGFGYLLVYHVFNAMPLSMDEYQNELTEAGDQAKKLLASQPAAVIDENALVDKKDDAVLAKGKAVFIASCVPCHRNDGGGNAIGPNLTDPYWIHGGEIKSIYVTIKNGVVEKGMPMWGKAMSLEDVKSVAFFVMSLQGSNPANAKAPQGNLFTPVEMKKSSDSTVVKLDSTRVQAMAK
jgi:cytochrome c oxidase cbb3-type subunit 3